MSTLLTIGSTALNMSAAKSQAKAGIQAAAYNQQQAEAEAAARTDKAAVDAGAEASDVRRAIGTAEAAGAADGLTLGGSAIDVIADLARQGSANVRSILWQGEADRAGLLKEANIANMEGKAAASRGKFGVAGALLNGGHQLLSDFSSGMGGGSSSVGSHSSGGGSGGSGHARV